MHDPIRCTHRGVVYQLSCTVDDNVAEPVLYDVSIWHEEEPEQFTPAEANTPLRHAALDAVYEAYGIHPLLEEVE